MSDHATSHTYEYTSQALVGGERIHGYKERPSIAPGLRLPRATSRPFTRVELAVFFSGLYEVQIHFWYQIRVSKRLIPSSPSLAIYFADSQHDSRDV